MASGPGSHLKRWFRGERGAVATLAAILCTTMIGMGALTVDVGTHFTLERQLQNAVDAAAHAGAQFLPDTTAANNAAYDYWNENVPTFGNATLTVTFPPGPPVTIHIEAEASAGTAFGRVLGISSTTVRASAEAGSAARDVVLVLDRSGSMCYDSHPVGSGCPNNGVPWQPFTDVQTAAKDFSHLFIPAYDLMGLVSYSTTATTNKQLSSNFGPNSTFDTAINGLTPDGYTNIGHGIQRARQELAARSRPDTLKVIVLLTDGIANVYPNPNGGWTTCGTSGCSAARNYAKNQAQIAADAGYVVHVIGMGDGVNDSHLQEIADIGNGIYIYAPDASELQSAFNTIAQHARVFLLQ